MNFEGFDVAVVGGHFIPCTWKILQLCLTLDNCTVIDDFYVVELQDTNVILGVQWLVSIGKHSIDYQAMEMEFKAADGRKVILWGMSNDAPRIVSSKRMDGIFKHEDVSYGDRVFDHY